MERNNHSQDRRNGDAQGRRVEDDNVRPFVLAKRKLSFETIQELEILLDLAKRGEIIGFAYAALRPRQRYEVGYTGQFVDYPDVAIAPISRLLQDIMSI